MEVKNNKGGNMITLIIMVIIIAVVAVFSVQNAIPVVIFFLMEIRYVPCNRFISHWFGRCDYRSKCNISL